MEDPLDPEPPRPLDPVAILDAIPAVVAVIDPLGTVVYASGHLEEVTGYRPEELIGTGMLDHIDTTWNPLTLDSILYALDNPGIRLPTMMRFRMRSGPMRVLEVVANNQLENPDIQGLIVHIRDVDERELTDQILEAFAAGEDVEATLTKLHAVGAAITMESDTAVVLQPPLGDLPPHLAATAAVAELVDSDHPESPWARTATGGDPWLATDVDDLPEPLAELARSHGYAACWTWAVPRRGRGGEVAAVLVFWRRTPGPPEPSAQTLGERLVRLTMLVMERAEHLRDLLHTAGHDPLTGLANRVRFFAEVDRHLADAEGPVGVLYLDLDRFKPINDVHGHGAGDRVLVAVADRLRGAVRPGDLVGRLGGDEFAVCCPGADTEVLGHIAERLLAAVPEPIVVDGRRLTVGTTIGLAWTEPGASTSDVLLDAADRALVEAKAGAKGTWRAADARNRP